MRRIGERSPLRPPTRPRRHQHPRRDHEHPRRGLACQLGEGEGRGHHPQNEQQRAQAAASVTARRFDGGLGSGRSAAFEAHMLAGMPVSRSIWAALSMRGAQRPVIHCQRTPRFTPSSRRSQTWVRPWEASQVRRAAPAAQRRASLDFIGGSLIEYLTRVRWATTPRRASVEEVPEGSKPCQDGGAVAPTWSDSTLKERLHHVADLRGVSQTALGERAGIRKGEMSNLMRRPRPSAAKLGAIASAWGISLQWLANGRGPVEDHAPPPDRYPNRAVAGRIAQDGGVPRAAVDAVLREPLDLASDQPVLWWIHRMERRAMLLETELAEGKAAVAR